AGIWEAVDLVPLLPAPLQVFNVPGVVHMAVDVDLGAADHGFQYNLHHPPPCTAAVDSHAGPQSLPLPVSIVLISILAAEPLKQATTPMLGRTCCQTGLRQHPKGRLFDDTPRSPRQYGLATLFGSVCCRSGSPIGAPIMEYRTALQQITE